MAKKPKVEEQKVEILPQPTQEQAASSSTNSAPPPLSTSDVAQAERNVASVQEGKGPRKRRTKAEMAVARGAVAPVVLPPPSENAIKMLDGGYSKLCTVTALAMNNEAFCAPPDHSRQVAELAEECMRTYFPQLPTRHAVLISLVCSVGFHFGGAYLSASATAETDAPQAVQENAKSVISA